ncbi:hypothetical protein G7Y79_00026g058470 [Physcia stellaris]|nr:hypothetical protein G7Y79_00026g058470 [Physcia stellaris]
MLYHVPVVLALAISRAAAVPKPQLLMPAAPNVISQSLQNQSLSPGGPHLVNDSKFYHIPDTTINMYLRDIGDRLPLQDVGLCLQRLEKYALQQMTIHGDDQAVVRRYRYGKVAMSFTPLRMKWGVAVLVMDNLEIIFMNHDWTHISLTYAAYGDNLDSLSVFIVLNGAKLYVDDRVKHLGPVALVDELHPWKVSDAELTITPSDRLRWFDVLIALEGLMDFVDKFDTFAFAFQIRYQGGRLLGHGQLRPGTEKDSTL